MSVKARIAPISTCIISNRLWAMMGIITFSSSWPACAASATVRSQPWTWKQAMLSISASTGLTLPGMMLLPGCTAGRRISSRPVAGPLESRRKSLAMRVSVMAQRAQARREVGGVGHALHRLEQVAAGAQGLAGQLAQARHHACVVLRVGVQAGAGGGAADAQPAQPVGRGRDALAVVADGLRVRAELLAQPHRHGILQVRAARFHHVVELDGLRIQRRRPARPPPPATRPAATGSPGGWRWEWCRWCSAPC